MIGDGAAVVFEFVVFEFVVGVRHYPIFVVSGRGKVGRAANVVADAKRR